MARGLVLTDGVFRLNLDADVGIGCPNKMDDVQLVQFGYWCKARNPKVPPTLEEKAVYSLVIPGAFYTGSPTDPLSAAIIYHAKHRGTYPDGRISVASGTGSYDGAHTYMILSLAVNIQHVAGPELWPRVDKMQGCPPVLRQSMLRTFGL